MLSFQVSVLGSLFVSFHPSLIRFPQLFLRCLPFAFAFGLSAFHPLSFVRFCSASGYSAFCFFRSLLPGLASQWLFQCFGSSFRLPRSPPSLPPGFPCFFSGFRYLAFCLFPFILPGFAPTAVPPVLPFFSASSRPLLFRAISLLSAFFRPLQPASDYSAFCSFFSLLPVFPWQRFLRCSPVPFVPFVSSSVRPVSMPSFRFRYSASCISFLRFTVSCHRHYAAPGLLFPARPFPFAFALGSGYSACLF